MSKLTYEDKINLYNDRKNGMSISSLESKYGIRHDGIKYIVRLIDKHCFDILRTSKNKYYSLQEKENEYLKVELEYSKKLRGVIQTRKNQQQKKKYLSLVNFVKNIH